MELLGRGKIVEKLANAAEETVMEIVLDVMQWRYTRNFKDKEDVMVIAAEKVRKSESRYCLEKMGCPVQPKSLYRN